MSTMMSRGAIADQISTPATAADTRFGLAVAPARSPRWGVVALAGTASVALLGGFNGSIAGLLVGAAIVVVPGIFIADLVGIRSTAERAVLTISTSLAVWAVVAHVMLSFRWWEPRLVTAVLLGLGATVAAIWQADPVRSGRNVSMSALVADVGPPQLIVSAAAIGLWAASLPSVETDFDDWGLISAVPPTFFVAWALAVGVAAVSATATRTSPRRLAFGVAPLLAMVYATMPLLVDTIRYPWAYKHVGVIRLLDDTGRLHTDVDIYNNFSGFFGIGALLRGAVGADPTSYAAWSQLAAEAAILTAVWLLVRYASSSERVAHLATVLYLLTNWVGQNYFAAQTLATFFCIAFLAVTLSWFMDHPARQPRRGPRRFRHRIAQIGRASIDRPAESHRAARLIVALLLYLGVMMTHPLTPAVAIGVIGAGWMIGWIRDRPFLIGVVTITIGWAVRCITYFAAQSFDLGFGGQPTENADGNLDVTGAPAAVLKVSELTRTFSLVVWIGALVGALICAFAMRRTSALVVAGVLPFGLPLVQSYGGEVIYRVYLYTLPMVVGLAAWGIVALTPLARRRAWSMTTVIATIWCLAMSSGFLIAHYGREGINTVDPSEVAMGDFIAANVPGPALLAQFDGFYPAASSARYPSFQVNDTYTPYIVEMVGRSDKLPSTADLDEVADDLIGLKAGRPYVIVSPGMIESLRQVNALPLASTQAAVDALTINPRFVVRHRIGATWLVEVLE